MFQFIWRPVKCPYELLLTETSNIGPGKCSTSDHLVTHHLKTVEDADSVGWKLHPPVLLVSHVRHGGAFLSKNPELCEWKTINQTESRHERLSNQKIWHPLCYSPAQQLASTRDNGQRTNWDLKTTDPVSEDCLCDIFKLCQTCCPCAIIKIIKIIKIIILNCIWKS